MSFVDTTYIDIIKNLQKETGQDLLKTLTDLYFTQAPDAFQQMKGALLSKDFETLKREAHSLKSSSATLGMQKIFEICKSIEDETTLEQNPSLDKLEQLLQGLDLSISPSLDALKSIIQLEA